MYELAINIISNFYEIIIFVYVGIVVVDTQKIFTVYTLQYTLALGTVDFY